MFPKLHSGLQFLTLEDISVIIHHYISNGDNADKIYNFILKGVLYA